MSLQCAPHDNKCELDCQAKVAVHLNPRPEVYCHRNRGPAVQFPVELKITPKPFCSIKEVKTSHCEKDCTTRCVFLVSVDFDCEADVVAGHCDNPQNIVDLDVRVPVSPKCKVLSVCGKKNQGRSSHSSKDHRKGLRHGIAAPQRLAKIAPPKSTVAKN